MLKGTFSKTSSRDRFYYVQQLIEQKSHEFADFGADFLKIIVHRKFATKLHLFRAQYIMFVFHVLA